MAARLERAARRRGHRGVDEWAQDALAVERSELGAAVVERRRGPERRHGALQVDVDAAQQPAFPEDDDPGADRHQQEQGGDAARDEVALRPEVLEAGRRHGAIVFASPAASPSTWSMPKRPDFLARTNRAARRLPSA